MPGAELAGHSARAQDSSLNPPPKVAKSSLAIGKVDFQPYVSSFLHVKVINAENGPQLLAMLAALANPHRLRIVATLSADGRNYVSQLAREIGISRPLLHLHLQKLEEAGLVTSRLELSKDGKALNYFEVTAFAIELTPAAVAAAARSLPEHP